MNEKRFIELLELNNAKLLKIMNEKFDMIDEKFKEVDKNFKKIDEKFKDIDERMIDNNFYFEENYGRKIDIIFEKLQLEDEKKDIKVKEFENFKNQNNAKLLSHEVRITNLEKAVNSN